MGNDQRKGERLPRYKFHPSSSGSLITFFKVASRSSTKLVIIELRIFQSNYTGTKWESAMETLFYTFIKQTMEATIYLTVVSVLGAPVSFEAASALLPWD